ncbi:unnamed protein product, partial [Brenthis ino]
MRVTGIESAPVSARISRITYLLRSWLVSMRLAAVAGIDATNVQPKRKVPPRPRPGQKKFLSSVLTILSKSTASTQYPDVNEFPDKTRKPKPRRVKNDKIEAQNAKIRYKSRVLNQNVVNDEDFVILQSKKDIAHTTSNYSETTNIRWSDLEISGKENSKYNEVVEGKKFSNKDESTTVTEMDKNDDKIYNLFVDLLETTFNINNVQTEHEKQLKKNDSNIVLEINEEVAKKLEIKSNVKEEQHTVIKDEIELENDIYSEIEDKPINVKLSDIIQPKLKAKSFVHVKKTKTLQKSKSLEAKKSFAKSKKKTLLNILKEQLEMDITYEEPQNLYEALKVLAKNKHRSEKCIEYHKEKLPKFADNDRSDTECMFRQRNLFLRPKRKKKTTKASPKQTDVDRSRPKKIKTNLLKSIPSYKSVEVYGYNYEEPEEEEVSKRNLFTYTSLSVSDVDYYTLLKFPDTSNSNISYQPSKFIYNN